MGDLYIKFWLLIYDSKLFELLSFFSQVKHWILFIASKSTSRLASPIAAQRIRHLRTCCFLISKIR